MWESLVASPCEEGAQDAGRVVQEQLAGDRGRCHPFEGRYDLGDGVVVEEQEGDGPLMAGAVDALAAVDREVAGDCCDLAAEAVADGELGGVGQRERRGLCGIRCVPMKCGYCSRRRPAGVAVRRWVISLATVFSSSLRRFT
ncbi:hypothetical protein DF19_40915 [Streptomyces olindensis]|nr:hypothetical protein DF19_40915 [Streptomyces olindensis]